MILNINGIYAEFVDRFLTIIQDDAAQNQATLVSGFLRAKILNSTVDKGLSVDQSFVPLSAVLKSGLVNKEGNISKLSLSEQARRILFSFDQERTLAQVVKIGLEPTHYTEAQQLILVTACQEAK